MTKNYIKTTYYIANRYSEIVEYNDYVRVDLLEDDSINCFKTKEEAEAYLERRNANDDEIIRVWFPIGQTWNGRQSVTTTRKGFRENRNLFNGFKFFGGLTIEEMPADWSREKLMFV